MICVRMPCPWRNNPRTAHTNHGVSTSWVRIDKPFSRKFLVLLSRFFNNEKHLNWLIDYMVFNAVFNIIYYIGAAYPCFPVVLFISSTHNILSKPQSAFPHNHRKTLNCGERGWTPLQKLSSIRRRTLAWPGIEPSPSCSQVLYTSLPTELPGSARSIWSNTTSDWLNYMI